MNKYIKFTILAVVIVVAFVGIKVLYDNLAKDYTPESQIVVENASQGYVEETVDREDATEVTTSTEEQQTTQAKSQSEEDKAFDFTVVDASGNTVALYDKLGKPIVVNFWASWCNPCKSELPDFQLAYEECGNDVEFMMVNLTDGRRETVDGASGFINAQGYTFPVYYDVNQEGAMAYYVVSIPTTYFIDSNGYIVAYAQGMIDYDTLMKGISMIK